MYVRVESSRPRVEPSRVEANSSQKIYARVKARLARANTSQNQVTFEPKIESKSSQTRVKNRVF